MPKTKRKNRIQYVYILFIDIFLTLSFCFQRRPKLDLSMSNNVLNIHTCSDSCASLIKLIKYIASDGDLDHGNQECFAEQISQNEVPCYFPAFCWHQVDINKTIYLLSLGIAGSSSELYCVYKRVIVTNFFL